jgi:ketosteroid isomerase-like protein
MQRSPEIEDLVRAWFAAASAGDPAIIDERVPSDSAVRLIGSDPAEWLSGGEEVRTFLRGEVQGAGGAVRFAVADVEAHEEGTVGWAAARITITKPDGGTVSPRWTSVLRRHDDRWTFVQTHASIAVSNLDVGWHYD